MAGKYPSNIAKRTIAGAGKSDAQCKQESDALKPPNLTDSGAKVWDRVCVLLIKEERMKALFVDSLHQYCRTVARMGEIVAYLADPEVGRTYEVKNGRNGLQIKNRPEIAEYNELFRQWNSLVAQWGLSPAVELRFTSGQQQLPLGGVNGSGVFDGYPTV